MAERRIKTVSVEAPNATAPTDREPFHIDLFGQSRFRIDGKPFPFPAHRKTLQVLAYLLIEGGSVDRATMACHLWPDEEEDAAGANLRRNLHLLQQHLPPAPPHSPWIVTESGSLRWDVEHTNLDIVEFEHDCDKGRLAHAVQLYRGDLLESMYDEWIAPERERLRLRFEEACRTLLAEHRSRREFGVALGYADRLLTLDPLREDLVRVAIAMRYENGDRAGALAAFRNFAKLLHEELNVDPMPETVALRDAILDDADVGAMTGHTAPPEHRAAQPHIHHTCALPFVGRESEFERLLARYRRATAGEGGACGLFGEAGIGKSRMVTELVQLAESHGTRVLVGTTTSPETLPYQTFVSALRPMIPQLAKSRIAPVWLAALAPLFPVLAMQRGDLPALEERGERRNRDRIHEAFAVAFEELSRSRPLLIILEDLHWAGAATIGALDALRERLSHRRVLFVVTARDDGNAAKALRGLRHGPEPLETIALGPLPASAVMELAGAPGIAAGLDPAGVRRLFERAEGHPLFLLDLIAHSSTDEHLPPAIDAAIARRLDGVNEDHQLYLDIAATIGSTFDLDTLVAVSGGAEREADAALDALIERNTIRRTSHRRGADYAFTHHLIHEVAYARVDDRARARFHRRIGAFLSERDGVRSATAARIAHHYAAGGESELAAEAFAHASTHAEQLAATGEALALAELGLTMTEDTGLRISLLFSLEQLTTVLGEIETRAAYLEQLRTHVPGADTPERKGELLLREMSFAQHFADDDAHAALVERMGEHAEATGDPSFAARASHARAVHADSLDRCAEAVSHALQALALYRKVPHSTAPRMSLIFSSVEAALLLGWHEVVDQLLSEGDEILTAEPSPIFAARLYFARTETHVRREEFEEAAQSGGHAVECFAAIGDLSGEGSAQELLGNALLHCRRFDESRAAYERSLWLARAIRKPRALATAQVSSVTLLLKEHDYHRALELLDEGLQQRHLLDGDGGVAKAEARRAFALLQLGRPEEAEAAARASIASISDNALLQMVANQTLGPALYEQGRIGEAIETLESTIALQRSFARRGSLADTLAWLLLALLDSGSLDRAEEVALELAPLLESGAPLSEPYLAFWALARYARASGDAGAATGALRSAIAATAERESDASHETARVLASKRRHALDIRAAHERDEWPDAQTGEHIAQAPTAD